MDPAGTEARETSRPLGPNQQLAEYRIVRTIGRGAFGTVYLAQDTLLDRPVAIKELTVTLQTDETAFKRFVQQARTVGGLNHHHIATVHALKIAGPDVNMVMEYLAGGSPRDLLNKQGRLLVEGAVGIAVAFSMGLAQWEAQLRATLTRAQCRSSQCEGVSKESLAVHCGLSQYFLGDTEPVSRKHVRRKST